MLIGHVARRSGVSARMLRHYDSLGLVRPTGRTEAGYRLYGLAELNRLRTLSDIRHRFGVELVELAFARRLRREPELRQAVDAWLAAGDDTGSWVEWEQRKHERHARAHNSEPADFAALFAAKQLPGFSPRQEH